MELASNFLRTRTASLGNLFNDVILRHDVKNQESSPGNKETLISKPELIITPEIFIKNETIICKPNPHYAPPDVCNVNAEVKKPDDGETNNNNNNSHNGEGSARKYARKDLPQSVPQQKVPQQVQQVHKSPQLPRSVTNSTPATPKESKVS